jgi:transcription initiation factor TFIIF subunit beta
MLINFCRVFQIAATRVVGKIHHECHVSPANWKTYRDIMRKRVHEADRPTRSVQVLQQSSQPIFAPGASSGMPVSDFSSFIVRNSYSVTSSLI